MKKGRETLSKEEIIAKQAAEIEVLKQRVDWFTRMVFGSTSERHKTTPVNDAQLSLFDDDTKKESEEDAKTKKVKEHDRKMGKTKREYHPGRHSFPDHIEREEIILEPEEDVSGLKVIATAATEVLEYVPAKFIVKVYLRPQYAKPDGDGVIVAPLPTRAIDKGIPGEMLLTYIIISKYIDHMPLYRQVRRFKREKIDIKEVTMGNWLRKICELIAPLFELHKKEVLQEKYLQVDETPIKVLDREKKAKIHRGYYWAYLTPSKGLALFDYQKGRGIYAAEACLTDFQGYLQADGYSVYEHYGKMPNINLLGCWAHARRKFDQAKKNDPKRAKHVLSKIQKLYATEKLAREKQLNPEERLELRQKESVKILEALKDWLIANYQEVTPSSAIGKAIQYSLSRWEQLCVFTSNGILEIDNNLVENKIRPVALGRKNYLFAGSHDGAQRGAMLYSFFATCKMHNVNPTEWLNHVLKNIKDTKMTELQNLLPQNFSA
jgi:transposase